jgi:urea transport system ATP-binding protein|tara:strand:- start:130 stop:870 length:741 start_codon:yes stop_codon:yes gene_type:complete
MSDILEVRGISVSFDGFKAINNLSFSIGQNELRAIIGPNGAGKTTLMDIITGKTKPDIGDIRWGKNNISLIKKSETQIAQLGVGRKFQKPTVLEYQTVEENLMISLKNSRGFIQTLIYKYTEEEFTRVNEVAKLIKLNKILNKIAGELSHGQKQWLEIGMLLAQDPSLLLVDEPAAGMTNSERTDTATLLKELSKTRSVVVVEHDMDFIRQLNCKVTVLHEGSVLAEGNLDHVSKDNKVIEVYLGR